MLSLFLCVFVAKYAERSDAIFFARKLARRKHLGDLKKKNDFPAYGNNAERSLSPVCVHPFISF
jgi:hypothetical protein